MNQLFVLKVASFCCCMAISHFARARKFGAVALCCFQHRQRRLQSCCTYHHSHKTAVIDLGLIYGKLTFYLYSAGVCSRSPSISCLQRSLWLQRRLRRYNVFFLTLSELFPLHWICINTVCLVVCWGRKEVENVFLTHSWEYIFEFAGVFRPHGLTCPAHPPFIFSLGVS